MTIPFLQEAVLRSVNILGNPAIRANVSSEAINWGVPTSTIESVCECILGEIYPGFAANSSINPVTQLSTTYEKIQQLSQENPQCPVNWNQSLASVYSQLRFGKFIRSIQAEIEEPADFFDTAVPQNPETLRRFLQEAIRMLDAAQLALPAEARRPGVELLFLRASNANYWEGLNDLISQGVNLNIRNINRWTALHLSVNGNNLEAIRALIHAGADRNIRDNEGRTADTNSTGDL